MCRPALQQRRGQVELHVGQVKLQRGRGAGLHPPPWGMGGSREAVDLFQIPLSENTAFPSADLC